MPLNVDEQLVNADWTKQTCDWPLSELGLCDERPVARVLTAAALNYDGPGGMVALYPSEDEAKAIAREGGEPWQDLHVTLFFFEDAADLPDELDVGGGALTGTISGIARFQEGEDGVPIVALPSVVGLNELRASLAGVLDGYSERYGFIPHMTLGYDQAVDPEAVVGLPVTFSSVSVCTKDGRRDFPLDGGG